MLRIKRILVVVDEPMVCALTARGLRQRGYEVIEASDGMIGYELACAQSFDLVVTDSRMPNLNGTELVAWLRLLNPNLPIIHISGSYGKLGTWKHPRQRSNPVQAIQHGGADEGSGKADRRSVSQETTAGIGYRIIL